MKREKKYGKREKKKRSKCQIAFKRGKTNALKGLFLGYTF